MKRIQKIAKIIEKIDRVKDDIIDVDVDTYSPEDVVMSEIYVKLCGITELLDQVF